MQYNAQMGGSIMGDEGPPALNSPENVESLRVYKSLFDDTTPPGAVEYDWGGREESFRQGLVANQMPEPIVDRLEVVDVNEDEAVTLAISNLFFGRFKERSAVVHAGERIDIREFPERVFQLFLL